MTQATEVEVQPVPEIGTVHEGLIVPQGGEDESHYIGDEITTLDIMRLDDGVKLMSQRRGKFGIKEAAQFLNLPKFVGERPFREPHLEHLIAEVEQGTFRTESVQIITCEVKGWKQSRRMNGQHTAWLVLNMDARLKQNDPKASFALEDVEVLHYRAENERFMRILYATIDAGAPRSQGNKLVSLLAGTPRFNEIPTDILRRLGEGLAFLLWPKQRGSHDAKHRAHKMNTTFAAETRDIGQFLAEDQSNDARHLLRAPVIAAMYATFPKAPGDGKRSARAFWKGVRSGAELKEEDPRMRLFRELLRSAVAVRGNSAETRKIGREQMFKICCYAWNAYREGRGLKQSLRSFKSKERPEVI